MRISFTVYKLFSETQRIECHLYNIGMSFDQTLLYICYCYLHLFIFAPIVGPLAWPQITFDKVRLEKPSPRNSHKRNLVLHRTERLVDNSLICICANNLCIDKERFVQKSSQDYGRNFVLLATKCRQVFSCLSINDLTRLDSLPLFLLVYDALFQLILDYAIPEWIAITLCNIVMVWYGLRVGLPPCIYVLSLSTITLIKGSKYIHDAYYGPSS